MNLRVAVASVYLPPFVKRRKLAELLELTAEAFGAPAPDVRHQSAAERLRTFAAFSNEHAEVACEAGGDDVARRLRAAAYDMGAGVRRVLRIRKREDAMRAARLLYRTLGIDFRADAYGRIVIRSCYFADWYTPRVCALMSALDEGVLAGLAGEGRLEFSARITEGCRRCEAAFRFGAGGAEDAALEMSQSAGRR